MVKDEVEVLRADPEYLPGQSAHRDRSARSRVAEWIKLRATEPGISNKEVARRLGISDRTLNGHIYRASKEGWLVFDDPLLAIEYEILPKVTANLNHFLDIKDRTVTIETAKGTLFKAYQDSKGMSDAGHTILALKIETSSTTPNKEGVIEGEVVRAVVGEIVGKGRSIED